MADFYSNGCGCSVSNSRVNEIYQHFGMSDAPLAMAYVPYQQWNETFQSCCALYHGTVFPELFKPFCGKGGKRW